MNISNIKHSKLLLDSIPEPFGQKQTKQHYVHNHYITCSNFVLFLRLPHTEWKGEKNTKKISIGTSNKGDLKWKGEKNTKKISIGTSNKDDLKWKGEKNTKKISIGTSNKGDLKWKGEKNSKKISIETSNKDDLKIEKERKTQRKSQFGPQIRMMYETSWAPKNSENPTKPPPPKLKSKTRTGGLIGG